MSIIGFIPSFNAGELSPLGDARTGLDKYNAGCRVLKNFIPIPWGGASKRPGMTFVSEVHDSTRKVRVEAFRFSTLAQYVIEFSHRTIRFIRNDQVVRDLSGNPLVIASPYDENDVFDLQINTVNDVIIILHPDYQERKLIRYGDAAWSLTVFDYDWPPLRDENSDGSHTMKPSATTGAITLTSSKPFFQPGHVGATFALAWANSGRNIEVRTSSTTVQTIESNWLYVVGTWNAYSFNYWDGVIDIQRSYDKGQTFEVIRHYEGVQGSRNISTGGSESKECWMRIKFVGKRFYYGGASNYDFHAFLEVIDQRLWGLVKITSVSTQDAVVAQAEVVGELPSSDTTSIWAEGAFSTYRGFPRTSCMYEGRLWFGGCAYEPMRIFGSCTEDFFNFRRTGLADGAIIDTLSSSSQQAIQWMTAGSDALLIGTQGTEYVIRSTNDAPLAPNNLRKLQQSAYGSAFVPPLLVNYVTLFIDRSRLRVREFVYNLQVQGFVAADMTRLSNHMLRPALKQWTFQQSFDAIVWAVTTDGNLVGLTYEREENVVGWHRHQTDGYVESLCTLYGNEGESDKVYVVTRRLINGVWKRFVEFITPDVQELQRLGLVADCVFLDAAVKHSVESPTTTFACAHLEGRTVEILADGAKRAPKVVENGVVTLDEPASKVVIGLPYEALLKPMKADIPMRDGSSQERNIKLHRLAFRVFQSLGGDVRADDDAPWQKIIWRDTSDPMGEALDLFTGEKESAMDSTSLRSLEYSIRSNDPYPFTLIALAPKFSVDGTGVST